MIIAVVQETMIPTAVAIRRARLVSNPKTQHVANKMGHTIQMTKMCSRADLTKRAVSKRKADRKRIGAE